MSEDLGSPLYCKVSGAGALRSCVSLHFIARATLSCDNDTHGSLSGAAERSGWISDEGIVPGFEFYANSSQAWSDQASDGPV